MEDARSFDRLGLLWLVRLRWIACAGIALVSALAVWKFDVLLPWTVLGGSVALTAVGNVTAALLAGRGVRESPIVAVLVLGDILVLTALLYYTGGAHNPFTVLYLLHITLAVMLLSGGLAWTAVALCGASFAYLFLSGHMLTTRDGVQLCTDLNFHLEGMLAATVIAGTGVVYFVTRLNASLAMQREALAAARESAERERRFASVATLAAGLAHELATPLSTIAVVSKELEVEARELCQNAGCFDDVKLIRAEVDRCRAILEKIGRDVVGHGLEEFVALPVENLVLELASFLPPQIAGRVKWAVDPAAPHMRSLGDHVVRSLAVLVKNAAEASSVEAPVEVVVRGGADRNVVVEVRDQGCGMTRDVVERLGEPFFTTKQAGSGMGLGFFIVRGLVERLGGRVGVESAAGKGSVVTLFIPAFEGA